MIGKRISHYQIIEKLGEGGMGEVYLAQDTKLKRQVAIKFLPEHLTKDKENVERFEREAEAAAALNHPNIVTIYDIIEEDGHLCIVMEYIEGKSLRDVINEYKMGLEKIIDITSQLSEGLSKAHKAGIVHRDIKPENIIIDQDARVKILDFGLAKLKGVSRLTKETSTLGTIHYMSPEQLRGEEVDHRSDIWSLGVVFYEMLAGDVPFKGDYDQVVEYLIQNKEHEPISEIAPEYNMVLHKLLSKETENRFQSFEELTEAITSHRLQSTGIINKKQRYLVYLISIIAIIVLGYLLYNYVGTDLGKDSTKQWENSIGVLPFDDLSSEKDQEWFCDGMTEQIISNLSRLPKLKVIARQSMMKYKDTDKSISEIGEELNVAYVLESSIRKYGNRIRVTAQLISTIDEYHVWSEDYDKEYREFFDVQDDVSAAIASNLLTTLSSNDEKKIKTNRTISTEAYEYYMKGMYFHHNKLLSSWDKIDFISSEKMLKNAIYLDPNYADAYASLADLYNTYYDIFVEDSVDEDKVDKNKYVQLQETYRDTATILNPNSPELHYVNGSIYQIKNMYDEAFSSFKIAIKLNPNNARYYSSLGLLLYKKGCLKLSIKCIGRAIELNPLIQHNYFDRGYNFYLLGELESAERDFLKSLDLYSNHKFTFLFYSLLLLSTKRFGEADSLNLYMEDILSAKEMNILRAINYAYKGQREKALNAIKSLREAHCTEVYALLGMNHKAITSLKKWLEIRKKYIHNEYFYLTNYRFFDNIRSDPRFQEILAKHKELYEENLEKYGDIDI